MNYVLLKAFLFTIIFAVLCIPIFFIKSASKKYKLLFLLLFSVFTVDILLMSGAKLNFGLYYNWTGKILATAFVLGIVFFLKRKKEKFDFGLTLKQRKGSLKPVIIVFTVYCLIEFIVVYQFFGKSTFNIESHLFQMTLPGISEEIIYRGFYLGVLNRILPKKWFIFNAPMGYSSIIVTLMFAMAHGLSISHNFQVNFNFYSMLIPFIFGLVVVWMRERTGSILLPVIFHNLTNELGLLIMNFKV